MRNIFKTYLFARQVCESVPFFATSHRIILSRRRGFFFFGFLSPILEYSITRRCGSYTSRIESRCPPECPRRILYTADPFTSFKKYSLALVT